MACLAATSIRSRTDFAGRTLGTFILSKVWTAAPFRIIRVLRIIPDWQFRNDPFERANRAAPGMDNNVFRGEDEPMMAAVVRQLEDAPDHLLLELDGRDAAVWLLPGFVAAAGPDLTARLLKLPWNLVLSEARDAPLLAALEAQEAPDDPLVRRRGLVLLVDANPADVPLPRRSLPVFLLNGREGSASTKLAARARRLTMVQELGRRSIEQLIILAGPDVTLPSELNELWEEGFRPPITVVSDAPDAGAALKAWAAETPTANVWLVPKSAAAFTEGLVERYLAGRDGRLLLRIRDSKGAIKAVDISGADDPQHPVLGRYELVSSDLLAQLSPDDLQPEELQEFFRNPASSWRPYAAGLPWPRAPEAWSHLRSALRNLDRDGPSANRIFYVQAESGAGTTTFLRSLAWSAAQLGYPTLVARLAPFTPTGLELVSFLDRTAGIAAAQAPDENAKLYQVPVLIVFDGHWEGREDQLTRFAREFVQSGRRACFLVTTGPYLPMSMFGDPRFLRLAELTHEISSTDASDLGRHLNNFLRRHGGTRSEAEWQHFYEASSVQAERGITAFWIALSFWLQRQFDMHETVQAWVYRQFKVAVTDLELRRAVISIAAFSSERLPLPDAMLPLGKDWPVSERLSDLQSHAGALGLMRVRGERERYWALIHDLLGRFLLNSLFYDRELLGALGFGDAENPEHLRFLAFRRLSTLQVLERPDLREIADAFAISIFKIDPAHGHSSFAPYWREVLAALDEMPRSLRATSRPFLHHSAVSRRRIAKDSAAFRIDNDERAGLLSRAIADIETALSITDDEAGESDLHLLNSLGHAYHDLAEVEQSRQAARDRIDYLQGKAREATRRAYRLNPDNSFVIETYARTLISEGRTNPELAAEKAIEVLGIVYAANMRNRSEQRSFALGRLADAALDLLMIGDHQHTIESKPRNEGEAIVRALHALTEGAVRFEGMDLSDYPTRNRKRAAEFLAAPELRDNVQAVKLRYLLSCLDQPYDFSAQLDLLQSLSTGGEGMSPQFQLEYAVLLHQRDRHHEADRLFRRLRKQWREQEHYVEIPQRLRWLTLPNTQSQRQVHARVSASGEGRYFARVKEFQDIEVVFRPQEFGQSEIRPGVSISGFISFGHNGPFLRPLTAI